MLILLLTQCTSGKADNSNIKLDHSKDKYVPAKLIGETLQTVQECETSREEHLEFLTVESYKCDINNDGKDDEIFLERIKDWGDDPGDFHRIRITSQEYEYSFFNMDGWVAPRTFRREFLDSLFSSNKVKSECIVITQSSDKDVLLFVFGFLYGDGYGLLSIINLSRFERPELIFNKDIDLYKYEDLNEDGVNDIIVQDDEVENINNQFKSYLLMDGFYVPKDNIVP